MAARVGEGNGGATTTKGGETEEEEEMGREPLGLSRRGRRRVLSERRREHNGLLSLVFAR